MTCNNLGAFYADHGRPEEVEKLYLEALETYRRLAESVSREAYEPDVAMTLYNMGLLYEDLQNAERSGECYAEAKRIAMRYKDTDPICGAICERLS